MKTQHTKICGKQWEVLRVKFVIIYASVGKMSEII